ncbi:MAG: hypothetical protein ACNYVW_04040 [Methanosarcinales archaeon]
MIKETAFGDWMLEFCGEESLIKETAFGDWMLDSRYRMLRVIQTHRDWGIYGLSYEPAIEIH